MTAHYVYRCFDSDDRLVYVGQTKDVTARMQQHQRAFWAPQVVKVKVKAYRNPLIARAVERTAIREEHPRFNLQGRWAVRGNWPEAAYTDFLLVLTNGNLDMPSSRWRLAQIVDLLAAYRMRFGTTHPRHDHLTALVNARRAEQKAEGEARQAEWREQSRAVALQDAKDWADHKAHCCACRFGIVVDDALIEKFGGEMDDAGHLTTEPVLT